MTRERAADRTTALNEIMELLAEHGFGGLAQAVTVSAPVPEPRAATVSSRCHLQAASGASISVGPQFQGRPLGNPMSIGKTATTSSSGGTADQVPYSSAA